MVAGQDDILIEGTTYTMTNGYPAYDNIADLANLSADYTLTDNSTDTLTVTLGTCLFTYSDSSVANSAPAISDISNSGSTAGAC